MTPRVLLVFAFLNFGLALQPHKSFPREKNIKTCVRSDRLSNTSVIPLGSDDFLLAGENGMRKHSMEECFQNFVSEDSTSQDAFYEISIN